MEERKRKPRKPVVFNSTMTTYKFFCSVCGNVVYLASPRGQAWCSNKHRMAAMKPEK